MVVNGRRRSLFAGRASKDKFGEGPGHCPGDVERITYYEVNDVGKAK